MEDTRRVATFCPALCPASRVRVLRVRTGTDASTRPTSAHTDAAAAGRRRLGPGPPSLPLSRDDPSAPYYSNECAPPPPFFIFFILSSFHPSIDPPRPPPPPPPSPYQRLLIALTAHLWHPHPGAHTRYGHSGRTIRSSGSIIGSRISRRHSLSHLHHLSIPLLATPRRSRIPSATSTEHERTPRLAIPLHLDLRTRTDILIHRSGSLYRRTWRSEQLATYRSSSS